MTDFTGLYSVYVGVPQGGFFGSHILVAKLAWIDEGGDERVVQFTDWFEALGADGLR